MGTYLIVDLDLWPEHAGPGSPPVRSDADRLRRVGDVHYRAAEIVARLEQGGWHVESCPFAAFARHPDVRSRAEARRRLAALAIDEKDVTVETTPSVPATRRQLSRRGRERPATGSGGTRAGK